jgi:hypothetical protein
VAHGYIADAEHPKGVEASGGIRSHIVELLAASGVKAGPRTFSAAMRLLADGPDLAPW